MPKELHDKLAREATAKGLTGDSWNAYVYGTLSKIESGKNHLRPPKKRSQNKLRNKE